MFNIVLVHPEIPPNTGNIIRLCANTGAHLHLVKPLGFSLTDRDLRRAGLDYHEYVQLTVHNSWATCKDVLQTRRLFACTTKGAHYVHNQAFQPGDCFVFGSETAGLPVEVLTEFPAKSRLRLPMLPDCRSLNLSNAVAVVAYEAWRQLGFAGAV